MGEGGYIKFYYSFWWNTQVLCKYTGIYFHRSLFLMRESKFPQNYFFLRTSRKFCTQKLLPSFDLAVAVRNSDTSNLRNSCLRFLRCPSFLFYRHAQVETSDVWEISETTDKVISIIPDFWVSEDYNNIVNIWLFYLQNRKQNLRIFYA